MPEVLRDIRFDPWSDDSQRGDKAEEVVSPRPVAGELVIARIREELPGCHPEVFPNVWVGEKVGVEVLDRVREAGLRALPELSAVPGTHAVQAHGLLTSLGMCHWGGWWLTFDASEEAVVARVRVLSRVVASSSAEECRLLLEAYVGPMPESVRSGLTPDFSKSVSNRAARSQGLPEPLSEKTVAGPEQISERAAESPEQASGRAAKSPEEVSERVTDSAERDPGRVSELAGQDPGRTWSWRSRIPRRRLSLRIRAQSGRTNRQSGVPGG